VRIDLGAVFNLLGRQLYIQPLGRPVRVDYGHWGNQHSPSTEPFTGVYNEVSDGPSLIVEIEVFYGSKIAVRSSDRKVFQTLIR
jgi:hypothetical protein